MHARTHACTHARTRTCTHLRVHTHTHTYLVMNGQGFTTDLEVPSDFTAETDVNVISFSGIGHTCKK